MRRFFVFASAFAAAFAFAASLSACSHAVTMGTDSEDMAMSDPDLAPPPPAKCGDSKCDPSETCITCPDDCGSCPTCSAAPSCDDAAGAPASPAPRPDLCVGTAGAPGTVVPPFTGPNDCQAPQLSMRVSKVHVNSGGGQIYCIITANDGSTSEVALTTKTNNISSGADYAFDPSVGQFWGQKGLHPTTQDIKISYKCFVVKSDSWARALAAGGMAAQMNAGNAGQYGWAFQIGGAAADVVSQILAATSGDTPGIMVEQTLKASDLLDLTYGRYWTIQQSGSGFNWTLYVQAWGCALGMR